MTREVTSSVRQAACTPRPVATRTSCCRDGVLMILSSRVALDLWTDKVVATQRGRIRGRILSEVVRFPGGRTTLGGIWEGTRRETRAMRQCSAGDLADLSDRGI